MNVRFGSFVFQAALLLAVCLIGATMVGRSPGAVATEWESAAIWGGCQTVYTINCGTNCGNPVNGAQPPCCTGQSGYGYNGGTGTAGNGSKTGGATCGGGCGSIATGWTANCGS
jgi:hypothetical protein